MNTARRRISEMQKNALNRISFKSTGRQAANTRQWVVDWWGTTNKPVILGSSHCLRSVRLQSFARSKYIIYKMLLQEFLLPIPLKYIYIFCCVFLFVLFCYVLLFVIFFRLKFCQHNKHYELFYLYWFFICFIVVIY